MRTGSRSAIVIQSFVVKFVYPCIVAAVNVILLVGIEPRGAEDEVWLELDQSLEYSLCKVLAPLG